MTTTKTLLMFAVAGLLTPATASAEIKTATTVKVLAAPTNDTAPVSGTPARLRRTNEEQAGNEMSALAFFKDGKRGLMFTMSTELGGVAATHRMQLSMVPFTLVQDAATGAVSVQADMTKAKFVTNNQGNEYRNANHPKAYTINNGNSIVVEYNYQPANSNDTKRYAMVFDDQGQTIMPQTMIFAKNNDDASMNEDGKSTTLATSIAGKNRLGAWRGANGNGADDGWFQAFEINCDAEVATTCSFNNLFDTSVCQAEERSHGAVSFSIDDPNTAIVSWTEGNTQPQRLGVWMAALDMTPGGDNGADVQSRLLWKKQIDGRNDLDGVRTYAMRAMHSRVMKPNATGVLEPTDQIIWRSGRVTGDNNGNNGKGGTYRANMMAVMKVGRDGLEFMTPLTDVTADLIGLDGTHLGMQGAVFGTTNALVPGVTFLAGSQTGGGYSAQVRAVTWDAATGKFADAGMHQAAPYDRHLYPNYLGNNPGNQGRNYANGVLIANPFVGQANNTDAHLMVFATTGKATEDMAYPERKLSAFISVLPLTQTPKVVTPPTGSGSGSDGTGDTGTDPDSMTNGGCSSSGQTGGLGALLVLALAAVRRRRR